MADINLKSERQIQTDMLAFLINELGLNDINPGSVIDILTQAFAQEDFYTQYQIAQVSRLSDIDALSGSDLDLKAFEYGIERQDAKKATGVISILRPEGFEKVATNFYSGSSAPIIGDLQINVNDASNTLFGTSGTLILGRGSNNEEEVSYSVAPTNNASFFTISLDSALINNHALEESVILKQGNDEQILAGTIVRVPATGTNEEIKFEIKNDATLLAGEASVDNVEVVASLEGTDGNISIRAISGEDAFLTPPFVGARAENLSKFTTGRDRETDDELRDRIKSAGDAATKGVKNAIQTAIVGLVDPNSAKRVVSASIILPVDDCGPVKIYIDDGTGLDPSFESQGFEIVRQNSTGGEERLQLDQFPIVKATLVSNSQEPFNMSSGILTLQYEVGTESETIEFNTSDFRFPDIASAEEISAAINDKSTLLEARTSGNGGFVTINAKRDVNESIQITGGTANNILSFPLDRKETINLYIDDVKQSKDGETAILDSGNIAPFDLSTVGPFPHTLDIIVDGKSANPQIATINLTDVADPSNVTLLEIANVLNRDIAGISALATDSNTRLRLISNTLLSSNSKLQITGGSANDVTNGLNFPLTEVSGVDGDFRFNRETGVIELLTPLTENQTVTVGSLFTRGRLRTTLPENFAPQNLETLIISIDGGADQTITFDASFSGGADAAALALFLNERIEGAVFLVREVGNEKFLEVTTNTYDLSGSVEVRGTSTGNSTFLFPVDTVANSTSANQAFQVSSGSEPYKFAQDDELVLVIDNDIVNSSFSVNLSFAGIVSGVISSSNFSASNLGSFFLESNEIQDYAVSFLSGDNTTTETVTTVTNPSGNLFEYTFSGVPANFADILVDDLISITGMSDSENNGNFVIVSKGVQSVVVENLRGLPATTQSGNATMSQLRIIDTYNPINGEITPTAAFSNAPNIGDSLVVIPRTTANVIDYLNNIRITSLSQKAAIEAVDQASKIQISSLSSGSDGFVQITGGGANSKLGFNTDLFRGIQAYNYWTGLIDLVHRTIYGDDSDLESFPGVGAAGITFQILAPTVKDLAVTLDVTLTEGTTIASLENEIKSVVSAYINALGVGEDVVIEEIRARVIAVTGIVDVVISEPLNNISIADNEIARISDPDITIG